MKLLVMSDSHGRDDKLEKIIDTHSDADMLVFLGDGLRDAEEVFEKHCKIPCVMVKGNCDWSFDNRAPAEIITKGGIKIVCCHGHTFGVKSGRGALAEYAASIGASLALYGHTHTASEEHYDGVTVFNPGAVCEGSFGIVYIENGGILCSNGNI